MIEASTLSRQVHRHLLEEIVAGQRPSGTLLRETELADELKVSRTPIREALRRLAADGLVEIQTNKSAMVRQLGPEQLTEVYQLREALEGLAAELACGRLTRADQQRLESLIRQTGTAPNLDSAACHRLDLELHRLIAARSGNQLLAAEIARFHDLVQLVRSRVGNRNQALVVAHQQHLEILAAVHSGDRAAARQAMVEHIRTSCRVAVDCADLPTTAPTTPGTTRDKAPTTTPANSAAGAAAAGGAS